MARRFDTISFLSDFGHADEFVGVVHSVIRSIAPQVTVVDLVHDLPAHDVRAASLALVRAVQYLAPGIVLAVVDPGVGTSRRAVAVEVGDPTQPGGTSHRNEPAEPVGGGDASHGSETDRPTQSASAILVGPDNGLLAPAVSLCGGARRAFALTNFELHLPAPGPTFAGRDVFASVAAHLCNGVPLEEVGEELDPLGLLPGLVPLSREENGALLTEVLWVDRYGNCQLNIGPEELEVFGDRITLRLGEPGLGEPGLGEPGLGEPGAGDAGQTRDIRYRGNAVRTGVRAVAYGDLPTGQVGLVVDSYGLVSIAFDRASAADELGLRAGSPVTLEVPR